jgi:hypothetical protein
MARNCVVDDHALFRSIAIGTDGELFSSFTHDGANLDTNILLHLSPINGATSAEITITLDCRTREVSFEFPSCGWTPDAARKGWDSCIYGPSREITTNKTARLILTPLTTIASPPITALDLLASNLTQIAFDNPSITAAGRKWIDGHVILMKAYDDAADKGLEFASFGEDGGINVDLGYAASFQLHITHFETGDVPSQEQIFRIKGWPPGTTVLRPPPPFTNSLRLAQSSNSTGIDCAADFTQWGVSNVTVQLWNGSTLVSQNLHVPATLASALVTLSGFPAMLSCPSIGSLSIAFTNPVTVLSGLDCGTAGCIGTELRILPELTTDANPPVAFTGLSCLISDGMDNLITRLQTVPACAPAPITVSATPNGTSLSWDGDGFRLQGAETVAGPWYDLGVSSPAVLPANSDLRVFRLICD